MRKCRNRRLGADEKAPTVPHMSRPCNLHPTIHGKKGAVYAVVNGKVLRLTRQRLLSGELPEDLSITYGVTGHVRAEPATQQIHSVGGSGTGTALSQLAAAKGVDLSRFQDAGSDLDDVASCVNDWCFQRTALVEAADAVVVRHTTDGPEVLMIERKHGPFKNALSLPGGLRDPGESLFEAAAREMKEEVGVVARSSNPIGIISSADWDPRFAAGVRVGAVRFDVAHDTQYAAQDDALGATWVPVADIAAGVHSIAFGHATWLAAAFAEDDETASRLAVIAEASRVRNRRLIEQIQERRAAADAMPFPELGDPHAGQEIIVPRPALIVQPGEAAPLSQTAVRDARTALKARPPAVPRRVDITRLAEACEFVETRKQPKPYGFSDCAVKELPPMAYTVAPTRQQVVTVTADGKETVNVAEPGDIVMSGSSGEKYVVEAAKFGDLYDGDPGETVVPNQAPRMAARYSGSAEVVFTARWGEDMVLRPGDYLVLGSSGMPHRVDRNEFEATYNEVRANI